MLRALGNRLSGPLMGTWFFLFATPLPLLAAVFNPALIYPSSQNPEKPSSLWLYQKRPYPTNAWFMNFMLTKAPHMSQPVNLFPYLASISLEGIHLGYTNSLAYAEPAYPSVISALFYPFEKQLSIGTVEPMQRFGLAAFHGSKIDLLWTNQHDQSMKAPLLQGSPYISLFFTNTSLKLSSPFPLISINQSRSFEQIPAAKRFELVFKIDAEHVQTWIMYMEKPIALQWQQTRGQTFLMAKAPFTGWARLVLQKDTRRFVDNDVRTVDAFSQTIPLDYQEAYYKTPQNTLAYAFQWKTNNGQAPLILSLPHHREASALKSDAPKVAYQGIKGRMLGETRARWEMQLPNPPIVFLEPKHFTKPQKQALRNALKKDISLLLARPFPDEGPYQMGKSLARAARLLLIAEALGENSDKEALKAHLQKAIAEKMYAPKGWHFEYDRTWGGIIPSVDYYGARHYNDHHFHYGYWIYAIAVLGEMDPAWLHTKPKGQGFSPKQWADVLVRDFANKDANDPFFPIKRHQEDYLGHSWASGLTAFQDGQNQQSSSEAVHAYYALALYAKALKEPSLYLWAEFLMARELKAAQTYWQVKKTSPVYPTIFRSKNRALGNLWDSKVDANAFFTPCHNKYRCGLEYAYGINMLPFTGITAYLLDKQWLKDSFPEIMSLIKGVHGKITAPWKWILVKGIAPILAPREKQSFFAEAVDSSAEAYDNGDSKTNTLYFLLDNFQEE